VMRHHRPRSAYVHNLPHWWCPLTAAKPHDETGLAALARR